MTERNAGLHVNCLRKTFQRGTVLACDDVDISIARGELLVLLGPSGCGKTTTLRCIAGLERPDNDDAIWVDGVNITAVQPKDRNLAFVFQDTALFPHLDVRRNISFGLDMRKSYTRAEVGRRVEEAGRLLKLEQLLDRKAHELSGGQGQRVALGRAIVMEPAAFLLDEPLANLDAALRVEMRTEIKLIQRKLNTTMVFVTHDQEEALTLGDKVAVMKDGKVQQIDTPHGIYQRPANLFVATFIGSPPLNRYPCTISEAEGKRRLVGEFFELPLPADVAARLNGSTRHVTLGVRPEFVELTQGRGLPGRVKLKELLGSRTLIYLDCAGHEVRALVQGETALTEGEAVELAPKLERAFFFDRDGNSLM